MTLVRAIRAARRLVQRDRMPVYGEFMAGSTHRPRRAGRRSKRNGRAAAQPARHDVRVNVPRRRSTPDSVVAHVGATNSAKTHDALEFLLAEGRGVCAVPLRMLAREVYDVARERLGEAAVGLLTGDEVINPDAPVKCCTAEMAPKVGHLLVLDEAHWAADAQRGSAWMRLVAGGEYRHLRLASSPDALPLLRSAFDDLDVRLHQRLCPLQWCGSRTLAEVEPSTLVVAFSRRTVLQLADRLAQIHGRDRVAAVYGSMPPDARRVMIDRIRSGAADYVVGTDVFGHGVNMPVRTVLFAESDKFDGAQVRPLHAWEIAQIAGRAGRYGHHDAGHVGVLAGEPQLSPRASRIHKALTPSIEIEPGVFGYRRITTGRVAPDLQDLNVTVTRHLPRALHEWERQARTAFADHEWVDLEDITPLRRRAQVLSECARSLDIETAWQLTLGPLDPWNDADGELFRDIAFELTGRPTGLHGRLVAAANLRSATLTQAEHAGRLAAGVRWAARAFAPLAPLAPAADTLEDAASTRVLTCFQRGATEPASRPCRDCGSSCAPGRSRCGCRRARNAA